MTMTHYRKTVKMAAKDSPNVALALWQADRGLPVTGQTVVPGVLSWQAYCKKLATFSKQRKVESLDAEWYEGAEEFLVTKEWLLAAVEFAGTLNPRRTGRKWMGVDSGAGGDDTAWVIGDRLGVCHVLAKRTPDTNEVFGLTGHLAYEWKVDWQDVMFDLGGGGQQHVDRFRASNKPVRGVSFGMIKKELKRGMTQFRERVDVEEDKIAFDQMRSKMAWDVRLLLERPAEVLDPHVMDALNKMGMRKDAKPPYGLPLPTCEELNRQLGLIPLKWDALGKFKLLPKTNPNDEDDPETLKSIIGLSPDEFDAFCCMTHCMQTPPSRSQAGTS